jgi:CRISPR-associated exonuclease Cas4
MADPSAWADDERVMISALEHFAYCPRQCALIHVEDAYEENIYTLRGNRTHRRVNEAETEQRPGCRIERALPLYSDRLGLTGRADVVEFSEDGTPFPVEYKTGKTRRHRPARVQLCAQALCLEEMTGRSVPRGALFHAGSKRREEIEFSDTLRDAVEEATRAVRAQIKAGRVPPPVNDARCPPCSLQDACLPDPLDAEGRQRKLAASLFSIDER